MSYIDTDIVHHISNDDLHKTDMGDEVLIEIDMMRLVKLAMHHTKIHIALMALEKIKPSIKDKIYGCKITQSGARLDFGMDENFK